MTPEERAAFVQDVAAAIQSAAPTLSDDELRWVRLAIQKEAQTIELRKAIITKSLSGLVWAGLVGFGYMVLEWLRLHGMRF